MNKLDQFESVFKAAAKEPFKLLPVALNKVLLVTDLDPYHTELLAGQVSDFLNVLGDDEDVTWVNVSVGDFDSLQELFDLLEKERPDLVCSYRNLKEGGRRWPFSLGVYLNVLTQATDIPVLVLPDPKVDNEFDEFPNGTRSVMVITDQLQGNERLVNYGVRFTQDQGTLWLTHLEDDQVFERYMDVVSKIPSIDSGNAREVIAKQLLKEPCDYIESCQAVIEDSQRSIEVVPIVAMGHLVRDYQRMVEKHDVDLLVFNTKEEDQLAMHGVAYPLVVELRCLPLLML